MVRRRSPDTASQPPDDGTGGPPERQALDELFAAVYQELRRLASTVKRNEPGITLTPTALVNEAWIKLSRSPQLAHTSRPHFKGIAAYAMRQVLVEAARRRNAKKRAAGRADALIPLDESLARPISTSDDLLALDAALRDLARLHPRQAAIVEGRFFGGLDHEELAEWLHVSPSTVRNDWRVARAWLHSELTKR
ncbi:MAG TPA: ECF-type sigma factor [Vicinamibacterales bacterium]|jgi:RNA polymerase sigma factor (TIGR02999 family)